MKNSTLLGPWIRRFLLEHLIIDRNLARNTQQSYRDTLRQILPLVAKWVGKAIDSLAVDDLSPAHVKAFLTQIEETRSCGAATRNQRLAAIRSLAKFIALHSPEHVAWCREIRTIPFKRSPRPLVTYLEKSEMDALLRAPDRKSDRGRRDYAVLLFLYNTGARADEVAHVRIGDLSLGSGAQHASSVLIRGKGGKLRRCPLWAKAVSELLPLIEGRPDSQHLFLNRRGEPLTRYGIHALVERHAQAVARELPALKTKRVSPHTIRHTTATHLLRAGVDINTIRAWLGHVSLSTTNVYAEVDLEMKAKALAKCEIAIGHSRKPWRKDAALMEFLSQL